MTDLDAHAIVTHMTLHLRDSLKDFARRGRLSKEATADFTARGLIHIDEYGSPRLTDLGAATLKHIQKGI